VAGTFIRNTGVSHRDSMISADLRIWSHTVVAITARAGVLQAA